jgi:hypothetical protein
MMHEFRENLEIKKAFSFESLDFVSFNTVNLQEARSRKKIAISNPLY